MTADRRKALHSTLYDFATRAYPAEVYRAAEQVSELLHAEFEALREEVANPSVCIKVVQLNTGGRTPIYATAQAAGADLCTCEAITLEAGRQLVVPTGISLEIPNGFECQVRPRSGLSAKHKISVTNSPGTIDSDYRGEIKVIMINHGDHDMHFKAGDRIAQLVVSRAIHASFTLSDSLSDTDRGAGGFGSTGI